VQRSRHDRWVVEIARAEGMAKRGHEWFPLSQVVVSYDHARHAPLGDVITIDFVNTGLEPGARAGVELTLETAKELCAALNRAITSAEFEEAEVRGKRSVTPRMRAAGSARRERSAGGGGKIAKASQSSPISPPDPSDHRSGLLGPAASQAIAGERRESRRGKPRARCAPTSCSPAARS
jgi:hypothetical protein